MPPHTNATHPREEGPPQGGASSPAESSRSVPRRVWRGTVLLVLGRVWGSACTLLTWFLLSRHLAQDDFGRFTFYLAVFMLLDTLADFGTGQVAVQQTAHDEERVPEVLAAARRLRFLLGSLGVVLVGGGAFVLGERGAVWILLASLYPVTHVCELSTLVFRNRIAWGIPVAVRAFAAALSLSIVLVLRANGDLEPSHYVLGIAAGSATANFVLHAVSKKHLPQRAPRSIEVRALFLAALPLGVASLCQQAYFYVDNLFVRPICGEAEVGRYNTGVRVMSYGIMVAIYATQAALPWFARAHQKKELHHAVTKLTPPLFAAASFVLGAAWPWAGAILGLFHPDFASAAPSLRWLLLATATVYAGAGLMTALVAAGERKSILAIAAVALALNLALNAWLVPTQGITGAGLATFATELAVALGASIALVRVGASPWSGARAWSWLGGPVAFAAAALASSALHGG
ncbi:MAG: oligosaccharide flippase family protein [Planctomycetota bacterium]